MYQIQQGVTEAKNNSRGSQFPELASVTSDSLVASDICRTEERRQCMGSGHEVQTQPDPG